MAVKNVLKGLKTTVRKTRKVATKPAVKKGPVKKPLAYLIDRPDLASLYDAMEDMRYYQKDPYYENVIYKAMTMVPAVFLNDFFKNLLHTNDLNSSLEFVKQNQTYQLMKDFLKLRSVEGIPVPPLPTWRRKTKKIVETTTKKGRVKYVKYTARELEDKSVDEIDYLLRTENLPVEGMKQDKIDALLRINEERFLAHQQRYVLDYLSKCESDYKNAPWMRRFGYSVVGIALRKKDPFATDVKVEGNWYRAKASWYKEVCKNDRKFSKNKVGYILSNGTVVPETYVMYMAYVSYIEEPAPIGIARMKQKQPIPRRERGERRRQEEEEEEEIGEIINPPTVQFREEEKVVDLAPGLMDYVRLVISKQFLKCAACDIAVGNPVFRSVHKKKNVLFCSKKCFETYPFTK